MSATPILLTIDDVMIAGELGDSPTARDLLDQLPLTLEFRHCGGQEILAELPAELSTEASPARSGATPGDIGYYIPGGVHVLYYENVGEYAGIVPIGSFDDVAAIRALPDGTVVSIETAE